MPTGISWTDETWNPWWGCDKIAPECENCYAALVASGARARAKIEAAPGTAAAGEWTGFIRRNSDKICSDPLHWRKPHLVFTCSMSDFWHERVPLPWLDEALDVIERTPHLTYQVLTKRPGNIARRLAALNRTLPPNVWLGATVGHTDSLPVLKPLLRLPVPNLRFLSCEPLLNDIAPHLPLDGIGWLIAGGESGPGARRCNVEWVRGLRDKCQAAGVPFFLKQWGKQQNNPTPADKELDRHAKGGATLDGRLWREFPGLT